PREARRAEGRAPRDPRPRGRPARRRPAAGREGGGAGRRGGARMSLRRSVFGNWGVKLLALLLAWGIWYVVREDLDEPRKVILHVVARAPAGGAVDGEVQ